MIRLFLAVPVPPKIRKGLAKEIEWLKSTLSDWEIKWVTEENLHLTLIFLGWVPEKEVKTTTKQVEKTIQGFPSFQIVTREITSEKRYLWLEIAKGQKELGKLWELLGQNLSVKSSYLEKRPFLPHLTVGRVKKKGKKKFPLTKTLTFPAKQVILYESKLRKTGPIYRELVSFPFS